MFNGVSQAFGPKQRGSEPEAPRIRVTKKDNVTLSILCQKAGGSHLHIRLGQDLVDALGWELNQRIELAQDAHPKNGRWVLLYPAPDKSASRTHLTPYGGVGFRVTYACTKLETFILPQELAAQPVTFHQAGRMLCVQLPAECRHITESGGPAQPSLLTTAA